MFTLNSRDLRMWSSMISSRMISFQKVNGQVASVSVSLPDPVVLETEEQMLEGWRFFQVSGITEPR